MWRVICFVLNSPKLTRDMYEDCRDPVISIVGAYGRNICSDFIRVPRIILGSRRKYFLFKSCTSVFSLLLFP
jgi:hypothetical protein